MKTLEPPSNAGAEHATSRTGEQDLLWIAQRRRAPEVYLTR